MSRNNMLDISEFAVAMHLIQRRLKGTDIPEKLPGTLAPAKLPQVNIPVMLEEEKQAYEKAFKWKNDVKTGHIDGKAYKFYCVDVVSIWGCNLDEMRMC